VEYPKDYACDGQISITEWMDSIKPIPVKIKGLCDDAYCPVCGVWLDDLKIKDCERCPECQTKIDWAPWHRRNEEDV